MAETIVAQNDNTETENENESTLDLTETEDLSEISNGPKSFKRDSLRRRLYRGVPGSRRYRRWLNETSLSINHQEDPDDEEGNFEPIFYPRVSPFQQVLENPEYLQAWQSFVEVTEELQDHLLRANEMKKSQSSEMRIKTLDQMQETVSHCFKKIRNRKHKLLNNIDFLRELELEVSQYISLCKFLESDEEFYESLLEKNPNVLTSEEKMKLIEPITEQIESPSLFESFTYLKPPPSVQFIFQTNFHKLLAHGVFKFYNLQEKAFLPESEELQSTVVTHNRKKYPPPLSISNFLTNKTVMGE